MGKWEMVRLGDICEIVSGTTPKSSVKEYWNGTQNWVTPAELKEDTFEVFETERKITELAIKESNLKSFPAGTVLLSSRAPIGKVAIAGTLMYCNQGFKNLVCSEHILNKYLYWFLKGKTNYLNSLGRGATFKEISKSIVQAIEVPLPPLDEQKRIVKNLDLASEIVKGYKGQLAELDKLVQSVFYEMFGDLGNNSKKWDVCLLKECCQSSDDIKCGPFGTQLSKNEYQRSGIPIWGIPQISSKFKKKVVDFLSEEKASTLSNYSIFADDIVMSRKGNVGMCAIFPYNLQWGIMHSDVLRIRVNKKFVNPKFLSFQLHFSPKVEHQISVVSSGAIMPGVNVSKLKEVSVCIPPFSLQTRFVSIVTEIELHKAQVQQALTEAENLFNSLMQEYFE